MEAFMVNFRSDGKGVGGCIIAKNIAELRTKHPNVLVLNALACGGLGLEYIAGEEGSDHRALLEMFLGMAYFANSNTRGPDCYITSWHQEQREGGGFMSYYFGFDVGDRVISTEDSSVGTVVDPGYEPSDTVLKRKCVPVIWDRDVDTKTISWTMSTSLKK